MEGLLSTRPIPSSSYINNNYNKKLKINYKNKENDQLFEIGGFQRLETIKKKMQRKATDNKRSLIECLMGML